MSAPLAGAAALVGVAAPLAPASGYEHRVRWQEFAGWGANSTSPRQSDRVRSAARRGRGAMPASGAVHARTAVTMLAAVRSEGLLQTGDLSVGVRVLDAREAFGRLDYLVTPLAGTGLRWVDARRVRITGSGQGPRTVRRWEPQPLG